MNEKSFAMMNGILGMILESQEWTDAQSSPSVVSALDQMDAALEKAREYLPAELRDELDLAQCAAVGAISEAGILFGIHVGNVIREISEAPFAFSRYMLDNQRCGREASPDRDSDLTADLMDKITQSDEWQDTLTGDPGITAASERLGNAIEAIRGHAPASAIDELESAAYLYGAAFEASATLFGFRVAVALIGRR